jgi:isocitrate lyase
MATKVWSNVQVAMQSALGVAKTITAITKASTAVVSSTAHGLANGDVVILAVQGMWQLDTRTVRIANVAANTFELEGVDSTGYDTFTSGNAQAITFGTTFSTIGDMSTSGGDFEMIDITTIHDNVKKSIPGSASQVEVSGNFNWDPSDLGQIALKSASDSRALRAMRITFSDGAKWYFTGYPGYTGSPTGSAQGKVTSPFKLSSFGRPSFYAS